MNVNGEIIRSILENSVSMWPSLDGRFACISGLKYSFDPEQPAGSRVHSVITCEGAPFDLSKEASYNMAVKHFIATGRDGYDALRDPSVKWLIDTESAMTIQDIVTGAFRRFSSDYKIVEKREAVRKKRMALINARDDDRSALGFIKLRPCLDGRLKREPKLSIQ